MTMKMPLFGKQSTKIEMPCASGESMCTNARHLLFTASLWMEHECRRNENEGVCVSGSCVRQSFCLAEFRQTQK